jgi:hypothetical protein
MSWALVAFVGIALFVARPVSVLVAFSGVRVDRTVDGRRALAA